MLSQRDREFIEKLEEEKKSMISKMSDVKQQNHVCFLTYHKLKKQKKKINSEIKKIKNQSIPDIIA
jgi:hypothetical protein